ncbi:MAG: transcriptional regulator GcvA [Candidatus Competibacteraceae bacterium]|nr:transcriptional regulator GcvA [Candidatus Competibacteraceae bacterium]
MNALPSLHALRVFEAAARHLSFNRAAEELHLTPSAVSHQIRGLETFLGVSLFRRAHRKISLTPAGQRYLPLLQTAFQQIRTATERLMADRDNDLLIISVVPAFATQWLVPRLPAFQESHAQLEVRLIVSTDLTDFSHSDVDLAIRQGSGKWTGLSSRWLIDEDLIAVCSPALLTGKQPLRQLSDLRSELLLHVISRIGDWKNWLEAAGASHVNPEGGSRFQNWSLALEAAIAGMGVVIIGRRVVSHHLDSGRLIIPFDVSLRSHHAYYLVYPGERESLPKIAKFRRWLLAEVAKDRLMWSTVNGHPVKG